MTPLPIDLATPPVFVPFHRLRGLARRLHGCLLRCKEAWLQRKYKSLGTKDAPPVTPPMPLYWLHIQQATPQHSRRWWKRAWLRWWA